MALDDKKSEEKLEDLEVKIVPVNYSSASDLMGQVKNLLSDRGSLSVDSRTNVMIIKDIKASIDEAEALVQMLDTPTPQVLIEARIVEATKKFCQRFGCRVGSCRWRQLGVIPLEAFLEIQANNLPIHWFHPVIFTYWAVF